MKGIWFGIEKMAGGSRIDSYVSIRTAEMTADCWLADGSQEFLQFFIHPQQQVPNSDDRRNVLM